IADVGVLIRLRQAGKRHGRPGDVAARIGEELVELVKCPVAALALHRGREIESATGFAARAAHDIPQVWPNAVRSALLEGMAGLALLGRRLTFFHRGFRKQRLDRLIRLLRGGCALLSAGFLDRDVKTRLCRLLRRKNRSPRDIEREQKETGTEDGAQDLVWFEGIHRRTAPEAGRV